VPGKGEEIDPQFTYVDAYLAERLGTVGVAEDSSLPAQCRNCGDRLECADFVVRVHDGDESGACSDRSLHRVRIDYTEPVHSRMVTLAPSRRRNATGSSVAGCSMAGGDDVDGVR